MSISVVITTSYMTAVLAASSDISKGNARPQHVVIPSSILQLLTTVVYRSRLETSYSPS